MINVIAVKKYRGASILIINCWQSFIAIVFYRGQFYHCRIDAVQRGEYNNQEYLTALDTISKDAKYLVAAVKKKRSFFEKIKKIFNLKKKVKEKS